METYKIYHELPNRRALIRGRFEDLQIDDRVVVTSGDRAYDAVVETRTTAGIVVRVL